MPVITARMAESANELSKRLFFYTPVNYNDCNYGYYYSNGQCYYSGWLSWGRWVLLAAILVIIFLVFLVGSCTNARRRRRAGKQPMYGTAWMAPPTYDESQAQTGRDTYQMNNNQQPAYAPPAYPPAAGGQGAYAPPASPPPVKGKN